MTTTPVDTHLGVFYEPKDYAGFFRRLFAGLIDAIVLLTIWAVSFVGIELLTQLRGPGVWEMFFTLILSIYLYLGWLKASHIGTLGYRLLRIRVVDIYGRRPSAQRMILRCLIQVFVVAWLRNFYFDFLWMASQSDRRKLSDQFAGTYVVRTAAVPIGEGPIVLAYYGAFSYFLVFSEVQRPLKPRPTGLD